MFSIPYEIDNTKYVCNGETGVADKQIFLPINFNDNIQGTSPVIGGDLVKFSKSNYPGVDSIILIGNRYVDNTSNTSIAELYVMTHSITIGNSAITTNSLFDNRVFLQSSNLYSTLPDKEVRLGISFRSANDGLFAASGDCYLILYRK
jgi:hypothetical protein